MLLSIQPFHVFPTYHNLVFYNQFCSFFAFYGSSSFQRTLEQEIRGCQSLIIWTDCDREGENIGFEIIQVCKAGLC